MERSGNRNFKIIDYPPQIPKKLIVDIGLDKIGDNVRTFRVAAKNQYQENDITPHRPASAPPPPERETTPVVREATRKRAVGRARQVITLTTRCGVVNTTSRKLPPLLPRPPTPPQEYDASTHLPGAPTVDATWAGDGATPHGNLSHEVYYPHEMRAAPVPHFFLPPPPPPSFYLRVPAYEARPPAPSQEYPAPAARSGARYHPYRRALYRTPQVAAPTMQRGSYVDAALQSEGVVGGPYPPIGADGSSGGVTAAQLYDLRRRALCATLAGRQHVCLQQPTSPAPIWIGDPQATYQQPHNLLSQYSGTAYQPRFGPQPYRPPASQPLPYPSPPATSGTAPRLNRLSRTGDGMAHNAPFSVARQLNPLSGRVAHDSAAPSFVFPYSAQTTISASPWDDARTAGVSTQDHNFAATTYGEYTRPLQADEPATELLVGEATDSTPQYPQWETAQSITAAEGCPVAETDHTIYGALYYASDDVAPQWEHGNSHYF